MEIDDKMISEHLKQSDKSRYLACLLMADNVRLPISVLYAFNAEISRIRDLIREPLPGEIRLQWWREVTSDNDRKDEAVANPLADGLNRVIQTYNINRDTFDGYCRSKIFDLYDDPMPDKATYEGYCGETASMLLQWCCQVIDADRANECADASGHAGIAQSVAGHLALLPMHISRGQIYIPNEILSEFDLDRDLFLSCGDKAKCRDVIQAFVGYGRDHLEKARQAAEGLSPELKQAYIPLASVERVLNKADKMGEACFTTSAAPSAWLGQWDLWRSQRKGMF
jgi:phytoene synthase